MMLLLVSKFVFSFPILYLGWNLELNCGIALKFFYLLLHLFINCRINFDIENERFYFWANGQRDMQSCRCIGQYSLSGDL